MRLNLINMNIQIPSVNVWLPLDGEVAHIAKCARVCYASETGNDDKLISNLIKNHHLSMFRHMGVYYIIPKGVEVVLPSYSGSYLDIRHFETETIIATNRQFAMEHMSKYKSYEIPYYTAVNDERFVKNGLIRFTICIKTGIDITREYNRKSPNAISEQSTRYVDFVKKLGIVFKHCHWMNNINLYKYCLVRLMCKLDEWMYKVSRSKYGLNLKPQDARWCLFLDTMSKVVYTYSIKDWEYILNLRLYDYTGIAHPDAKIVAKTIERELSVYGYNIRNFKLIEHETPTV